MKVRTVLLTFVFCLSVVAMAFASDMNMGSWKLNEAKSKIPAGSPKNTSVVYTASGDKVKAVVEGVDAAGKPTHNEWTGMYDGKDYAVTGDAASDTRAIKKVTDHTYNLTVKKGGKVTVTGIITISKDSKTRTLKTSGKDAKGKKTTSLAVYDKQ